MALLRHITRVVHRELVFHYNKVIAELHLAGFLNPEASLSPAAKAWASTSARAADRRGEEARLQVWSLSTDRVVGVGGLTGLLMILFLGEAGRGLAGSTQVSELHT
jgi:hypothetical protein